jgi:hypothetical protein
MLKTFIVPPLDGENDIEFGAFIPYFGNVPYDAIDQKKGIFEIDLRVS